MKIDLKFICEDTDRHGNARLYVRRNGRKIRIRERWGTPDFLASYHAALAATEVPAPVSDQRLQAKKGEQKWVRFSRQFGGLAKVDLGFGYAANFSSSACIA